MSNADGTFTYTPETDFVGTDSFTYSLSDGVDSSQALVTINFIDDKYDVAIENAKVEAAAAAAFEKRTAAEAERPFAATHIRETFDAWAAYVQAGFANADTHSATVYMERDLLATGLLDADEVHLNDVVSRSQVVTVSADAAVLTYWTSESDANLAFLGDMELAVAGYQSSQGNAMSQYIVGMAVVDGQRDAAIQIAKAMFDAGVSAAHQAYLDAEATALTAFRDGAQLVKDQFQADMDAAESSRDLALSTAKSNYNQAMDNAEATKQAAIDAANAAYQTIADGAFTDRDTKVQAAKATYDQAVAAAAAAYDARRTKIPPRRWIWRPILATRQTSRLPRRTTKRPWTRASIYGE